MTVEQKFVNEKILNLIEKLYIKNDLEDGKLLYLIDNINEKEKKYLFSLAKKTRDEVYENRVYLRGLIEFTNHCNKRCVYCGINASNKNVKRYRLTKDEILDSCIKGKELGFKTFVLQGGEDKFFTDEIICDIVKSIKFKIPDCAVTLSIGGREFESYKAFKKATKHLRCSLSKRTCGNWVGKSNLRIVKISNGKTLNSYINLGNLNKLLRFF